MRLALVLTLALPLPAAAAMSAAEFDAYTRGKTLHYDVDGTPYGVEEYLDGRRVRWSFLDGACKEGTWYEEGGTICFRYEDAPGDPQCWTFEPRGSGLVAQFRNDPDAAELYGARRGAPMLCLGPEVGV